jgi:uncharacterized coiled-coil protein SlyX
MVKRTSVLVVLCLFGALAVVTPAALAAKASPPQSPPALDQRVATLEAQVKALAQTVTALDGQVTTLQARVSRQHVQLAALRANPVLTLSWLPSYLSLNTDAMNGVAGPNIVFTGANVHIVSGSGATDDHGAPTGLGNLVIGYAEAPGDHAAVRSGSHSLMLGTQNDFSGCGDVVAGSDNTVGADDSTVMGGRGNLASGMFSSVSGGGGNTSSGLMTMVSGGAQNTASGMFTSVSGGLRNTASTDHDGWSSVSGGAGNTASGDAASVSGGAGNQALGSFNDQLANSVSGGYDNIARGDYASVGGGLYNTATGYGSSVSGGNHLLLDMLGGWAAGTPGDPATPAMRQAWFLSPLVTATP